MRPAALVLAVLLAASFDSIAQAPSPSQGATAPSRAAALPDFRALVKKQGPAVVNVTTKTKATG